MEFGRYSMIVNTRLLAESAVQVFLGVGAVLLAVSALAEGLESKVR